MSLTSCKTCFLNYLRSPHHFMHYNYNKRNYKRRWSSHSAGTLTVRSGSYLKSPFLIVWVLSSSNLSWAKSSRRWQAKPMTKTDWASCVATKTLIKKKPKSCWRLSNSLLARLLDTASLRKSSLRTSFKWVWQLRMPTLSSKQSLSIKKPLLANSNWTLSESARSSKWTTLWTTYWRLALQEPRNQQKVPLSPSILM